MKKNKDIFDFGTVLQKKLEKLLRNPGGKYFDKDNEEYYKFLTTSVKKLKIANCAEKARLAGLICAVNGIKAEIVQLLSVDKKKFEFDKDLLVIAYMILFHF